jgi:hypothetical protein
MKKRLHTILRLMLVFIPALLLGLAQARAEQGVDTLYAGQTSSLSVIEYEGVAYYWELYNDIPGINFATDPGNCPPTDAFFIGGINTGDSVEVMWLMPGTYFFKVTATDPCSNNLKVGKMIVLESLSYATLLEPPPVCPGDTALLTVEIEGGIAPWTITFTDGTSSWTIEDIQTSPYTFQLIPTPATAGSYQYWITSVTSGTGMINDTPGDPVTLIVRPKPVTSPIQRY